MTGGSSALQADGPEFELLLDSARPPSATGGPPPIPDALDWSRLLERALDQGMVPLLFRRLEAGGWERVPWRVREWLTGRQEETRRRNRFLTTELLALLDRLTDERIEAIPFKGPIDAAVCYGELASRPFGDIDLLVRPADAPAAIRLLARAGYAPRIPLSDTQRAAFLRHRTEYPLQRPGGGGIVDLHWEIFHRQFCFPLVPDRTRIRTVELGGTPLPAMGPEDVLLVLCAHAAKHLWSRLEWVAGVAWLLERERRMEWNVVVARARRLGGVRMLAIGLSLAERLLGATPPVRVPVDEPAAALRDSVIERLRAGAPPPADWWRFYLQSRERRRDRARFLARTAVIPTIGDWRMVDLPPALRGLHYALRPVRLLSRGMRALAPEPDDGGPP